MLTPEKCPNCTRINEVLTRVGDRWSVLIIISLAEYGTLRFNELKRNFRPRSNIRYQKWVSRFTSLQAL